MRALRKFVRVVETGTTPTSLLAASAELEGDDEFEEFVKLEQQRCGPQISKQLSVGVLIDVVVTFFTSLRSLT